MLCRDYVKRIFPYSLLTTSKQTSLEQTLKGIV